MDIKEYPEFEDATKWRLMEEHSIEFDVVFEKSFWGLPGCRNIIAEKGDVQKKIGEMKVWQSVEQENFWGRTFSFWNSGVFLKAWYVVDDDSPVMSILRGARNLWSYYEGDFPIRSCLRGVMVGDHVVVQQLFFEMIGTDGKPFHYFFFENPEHPYTTPPEEYSPTS